MTNDEYKKLHGIRIRKGFIVQDYIVDELKKYINNPQQKKKIKASSVDFGVFIGFKEDVLFKDMKIESANLKKWEIDIIILKNNNLYLIEAKSGMSHNDHARCEKIKEILEDAKNYFMREYKFNPKKITKILLKSETYRFNSIPDDMLFLEFWEFEKLLNLPKTFTTNVKKRIKNFNKIHGIEI